MNRITFRIQNLEAVGDVVVGVGLDDDLDEMIWQTI